MQKRAILFTKQLSLELISVSQELEEQENGQTDRHTAGTIFFLVAVPKGLRKGWFTSKSMEILESGQTIFAELSPFAWHFLGSPQSLQVLDMLKRLNWPGNKSGEERKEKGEESNDHSRTSPSIA